MSLSLTATDSLSSRDSTEDVRVLAAPCQIESAVDSVELLSDYQAGSARLEPKFDGISQEPTTQTGLDSFLLRFVGSTQNVGLVYMAISAFILAMMGMFLKLAGKSGLSTWEIVCFRSLIVATVCLVQLACARTKPWGERIVALHVRGVLGMMAVTSLFFAMRYLPVADAIVFTFLAPLIILVASPYVLGEATGNQWLPILLASVGVVLICQPSLLFGKARLSLLGVTFGLIHATVSAMAKMLIRALKEEHTAVKVLYPATYCIVVSAAALAADGHQWSVPSLKQAALMLCVGIGGLGAQTFMTMSLERVEASLGMGMTYTAIIWSELVGVTVFREIPDVWAIVGTAIVLYSTLHNSLVQAVAARAPAVASPRNPLAEAQWPLGEAPLKPPA